MLLFFHQNVNNMRKMKVVQLRLLKLVREFCAVFI